MPQLRSKIPHATTKTWCDQVNIKNVVHALRTPPPSSIPRGLAANWPGVSLPTAPAVVTPPQQEGPPSPCRGHPKSIWLWWSEERVEVSYIWPLLQDPDTTDWPAPERWILRTGRYEETEAYVPNSGSSQKFRKRTIRKWRWAIYPIKSWRSWS